MKTRFLFIILVGIVGQILANKYDATLEDGATGQDVVEAALKKIRDADIFEDDKEFMRRLAFVESNFGEDVTKLTKFHQKPKLTRIKAQTSPNRTGIWQIDTESYKKSRYDKGHSRSPALLRNQIEIRKKFDIDWLGVTWSDLQKPLHSALAARLYLNTTGTSIPEDIDSQSRFFKQFYDADANNPNKTAAAFVALCKRLDQIDQSIMVARGDIVFVVDSSGSIGANMYVNAKETINAKETTAKVAHAFPKELNNIGVTIYGYGEHRIFPLLNSLTDQQIYDDILNMPYLDEGTNTYAGMKDGVDQFRNMPNSAIRPGVARVMMVLTDGNHNNGPDPGQATQEALTVDVTTVAVGIGSGINEDELNRIANGVKDNVITTRDYTTLVERINELIRKLIFIPQKPPLGQSFDDTLKKGGKRYIEYFLPKEGAIVISLTPLTGDVKAYWSLTYSNPNSAIYDGRFSTDVVIPSSGTMPQGTHVYITVEGIEASNDYAIWAEPFIP